MVQEGFPVRIFDKLYTSRELIKDIEPCVEVVEGDVERPQDVLDALSGGEICFHLGPYYGSRIIHAGPGL